MGYRSLELFSGHTRMFQPKQTGLKTQTDQRNFSCCINLTEVEEGLNLIRCNFVNYFSSCVSAASPAIMKMTPPARATLAFCSGWSDRQVVHFIPTEVTRMERNASKTADNIRPRAPWMIAEDSSDYRNVHTQFILTLDFRSKMFRNSCLNLTESLFASWRLINLNCNRFSFISI